MSIPSLLDSASGLPDPCAFQMSKGRQVWVCATMSDETGGPDRRMSEYRKKTLKELEKLRDTSAKDSTEHKQARAEIRRRLIFLAVGFFLLTMFADFAFRYVVETSR